MVYFEDEYEFVVITCLNNYFWIKKIKEKNYIYQTGF